MPKVHVPRSALHGLYLARNWSPEKIARRYKCTSVTIRHRLIEAGIPLKSKSRAHTRYARHDFSGSATEKAYMLGFRYGDLNVYQPPGSSETIVVRCHTTHRDQESVFTRIFSRYGAITSSRNDYSVHLNCYVNRSFVFLLDKYNRLVAEWLHCREERMWAFVAGYTDAEGNFLINQGRGRFKIDSYDFSILSDVHGFLSERGVRSTFRMIAREGERKYGTTWNRDLWRLNVNQAASLEVFIRNILPFLLHRKRIKDARAAARNIVNRRAYGTIK